MDYKNKKLLFLVRGSVALDTADNTSVEKVEPPRDNLTPLRKRDSAPKSNFLSVSQSQRWSCRSAVSEGAVGMCFVA